MRSDAFGSLQVGLAELLEDEPRKEAELWLEATSTKHMGKLSKIFAADADEWEEDQQKASCREAFEHADANGNGLLDREEIGQVMESHCTLLPLHPAAAVLSLVSSVAILHMDSTSTLRSSPSVSD